MDGQRKMFRMAERKEGVSMNEVFEKIIEKLEDKRKTAEQLIMENPQDELDRIKTQTAEDFASAYHDAIEIVKREAEQFGTDTNVGTNGWIPVSERLPEEHDSIFAKIKGTDKWSDAMFEKISDDVNATVEFEDGTRKTMTLHTNDGKWNTNNRIVKFNVIAWQPLPKPFQKGE